MSSVTTLILTLGLLLAGADVPMAQAENPSPGAGCAFSGGALICGGTQPTAVPVPQRGSPSPDPSVETPAAPAPTSTAPAPDPPIPGDPVNPESSGQTNLPGAIVVGIVTVVAATGLTVHLWRRRSRGAAAG